MQAKPGEIKGEARARKKAIEKTQRERRQAKKPRQEKFRKETKNVKKSIAASGVPAVRKSRPRVK
jgi:hypothetical protein